MKRLRLVHLLLLRRTTREGPSSALDARRGTSLARELEWSVVSRSQRRSCALARCSFVLPLVSFVLTSGCRQDMNDQPRYEAFEKCDFFWNESSARPLVSGVVPFGAAAEDPELRMDRPDKGRSFPLRLDRDLLERGKQRFEIFCSPCHDRVGTGSGIIVQRGLTQPPSFHSPDLRTRSDDYFFAVITQGFGIMPAYGPRIPVRDRWLIIAYVRALQLSQHAPRELVPEDELRRLGTLEH